MQGSLITRGRRTRRRGPHRVTDDDTLPSRRHKVTTTAVHWRTGFIPIGIKVEISKFYHFNCSTKILTIYIILSSLKLDLLIYFKISVHCDLMQCAVAQRMCSMCTTLSCQSYTKVKYSFCFVTGAFQESLARNRAKPTTTTQQTRGGSHGAGWRGGGEPVPARNCSWTIHIHPTHWKGFNCEAAWVVSLLAFYLFFAHFQDNFLKVLRY